MENLSGQATNLQNQGQSAVGNVQANTTAAVGNATANASAAAADLQSKIPKPPEVPQLPKLPNVPQLPGVPEFKQKELPVPKKLKNNKFKDKLAAAAAKAKQLAAKGQAAVAGAQAKVEKAVATAQEKAQKAVSDAQDKVKQGIASAEEKATATAEKAKQSAKDEIKKVQEGKGGIPLTEEEKDKIVINKTTEAAVKDAKPTQDAAKAAIEKSNQTIGKPDLSEPQKFVKTHTTPDAGNKFYIYQEREKSGNYIAVAYRNQNKTGYITNREGGNVNQGVNAVIEHLNQREDNVPEKD
jgi:hypothetical protein